jgi:preprotein translocase subunit SecA
LMRIFASDFVSTMMNRLGMKEGESIISPMLTRAIERAQRRVEEQNFSSRKNLLEYDDVMNQQRQVIYERRTAALLHTDKPLDFKKDCLEDVLSEIVHSASPEATDQESWDFELLENKIKETFTIEIEVPKDSTSNLVDYISEEILKHYQDKMLPLGEENLANFENYIYLQTIDQYWKEHLLSMDHLKDSVSLRGYAQRDPLQEYKKEAFTLFSGTVAQIEQSTLVMLVKMPAPQLSAPPHQEEHDDDFSDMDFKHSQPEQSSKKEQLQRRRRPEDKPQPITREGEKIGRNDPCPCGSGKKYKKCHGKN